MKWNNNDIKYILKRFIIYILISIFIFLISIFNVHASEQYHLSLNGIQTNNLQYSPASWQTNYYKYGTINEFPFYTWNSNNYRSAQFFFNAMSIPDSVDYGYLNLYIMYNDDLNHSPLQVTLNEGNKRVTSCDIEHTSSDFNLVYPDNTLSKTDNSRVYKVKCYINGGHVYDNIEIYNSLYRELGYSWSGGIFMIANLDYHFKSKDNTNELNNINSSINNVNDSINNDNVQTSDADDFASNSAFNDSTGLESVINLPLNMINNLTSTCQPINITIPFIDYTGEIPCMSTIYQTKFNSLYNVIRVVINGFFVYRLLLKIYELVHNAKQPDEDKLEVIEL